MPQRPPPKAQEDWMRGVANRMRKARKDMGINQKDFAEMLGMNIATFNKFERGHGKINLYYFYKSCVLLKKDANSMMGRKGEVLKVL